MNNINIIRPTTYTMMKQGGNLLYIKITMLLKENFKKIIRSLLVEPVIKWCEVYKLVIKISKLSKQLKELKTTNNK
jgi:hypothetical protein